MEEAPKPTLQDELEWCISQLETGLLRLHPTPKQAEETRRILGVLRSRKAPLVKKRQVMNRVFGNYRLKMAEERKRAAKAAVKPEEVEIKLGDPSAGVVYRKQSSQPSVSSTSWFVPSDNSFQFDFVLSERGSEEIAETTAGAEEIGNSRTQPDASDPSGRVDFSTGSPGSKFAFNFAILDVPPLPSDAADSASEAAAEAGVDSPGTKTVMTPDTSTVLKSDSLSVTDDVHRINEDYLMQEAPKRAVTQVDVEESKETKPAAVAAAGTSFKKKRKKKQLPAKVSPSGSVNGGCKSNGKDTSDQTETCQPDEQLKKEVDWCVEQLELGLKTRKSTPKQREEALRALKILRSEKTGLPKKRQLMRATFGDYRAKMAEEREKQLKLMQAASKAARIAEVTEQACRKKSQVFRTSAEKARSVKSPAEDFQRSSSSSADSGTTDPFQSFRFISSQEEFCFNFF
uniref:UPF0488 protein C8orf33 homolog n=1 Tax=Pogona vitticeps TaxID=103695 RepID=A0ABM5F0Q4_9SAUR